MSTPVFPGILRPLLFGHRGASLYAPENTWESFELAMCVGADVLETDVHMTRDGEVVVIHDETVDRTTNGHGRVRDLTYPELTALDAGWHFAPSPGDYRFRDRGVVVPRLADVLRQFGKAGFNIEVKQREPSMVRAVLDVLAAAGTTQVVLAAADDRIMAELELARPGVPLGLSAGQVMGVLRDAWLGRSLDRFAGRALQIPPRWRGVPVASGRVLAAARAAGIETHLWTLNDPRQAERWLARGVDGVMSDDPSAVADVVVREKEKRAGRPLGRSLAIDKRSR